ncbi:clan AA aspartic protease [Microcoleus sp. LEGE 07076]|uniref:clan AA aspartic protease n=1 Tax=Microcoleus sp. LEGE 07076 TaxID=915322 RepID=UPI0018829D53|nr:clan AA aspartic protease [Microcoleus sp. LEGE 07076]MBE9187792.1 clan AA aspartic protease [Microcoleus sp. LEGE 07076]
MKELNKLEQSGVKTMGAVRTQVKLTNAIDEALVSRGLLAPRLLRECQKESLVDTGSVYLLISSEIVQQLGLGIIGQQIVKYADGRRETVGVTEAILVEIEGRRTTEDALVTGDEVLIGQVILEKLDLLVDCKNQRLIPNPENPDYPVTYIK